MGFLSEIFGGGGSANTTNTSTSTTNVRDIGLTGQNATDALLYLNQTTYESLKGLNQSYTNTIEKGFNFGAYALDSSAKVFNQTVSSANETLANITNAARDVAQRNINAGLSQSSPITQIPAASSSGGEKSNTWIYVAAGAVILFFFMKD